MLSYMGIYFVKDIVRPHENRIYQATVLKYEGFQDDSDDPSRLQSRI